MEYPYGGAGTKAGTDDALGNAEYRTWGGFCQFFRWRTSVMGSEIYWHGILDYDNRDNWKLKEVQKLYDRIKKIIVEISGFDLSASHNLIQTKGRTFTKLCGRGGCLILGERWKNLPLWDQRMGKSAWTGTG